MKDLQGFPGRADLSRGMCQRAKLFLSLDI